MSYGQDNPYQYSGSYAPTFAAQAVESERAAFIRRTYTHLAGAIGLFIALEAALFTVVPDATLQRIVGTMLNGWNFLFVLVAFMAVGWVAQNWASSATSLGMQYLGLGLYVVAEAVIFLPILYIAKEHSSPNTIPAAGLLTGFIFAGLTAVVFLTKTDFSGLGKYLWLAGMVAMGMIVCSIVFRGFTLGILFSAVMIAFASGYILFYTSNVMRHYRTDQHVAAALALFAAVALLFWYVLRILMILNRR